ncbi:Enhancer of polycomb-like protein 1 [Pseudogymnoascus destructans]|uniref:Enhancer of polycomb-like protein n=2 Tax=Pseudogymnoascus destructans TaxID=655981 RepID=L8GC03_PSED2|nr:Enhancer of polycomb-like protein 1 [Pseudogymnoascus destructans]ELR10414.1 hypothetical protein GMDG_00826 [Pseudogymnoascus destructans 20631-21]OAF63324.1 Enhancer of polycomb-like protein 1 [Pseudogymnoascus destructans]
MTRSTQPGLRFRTRKLSPKQPLNVIREDQIDSDEYKELVDNQYKVETGVEKSEENEYHLQEALAAALGRGSKEEAKKIVPAPPSEETKDINYDELYAFKFSKSSSYIRFSQTVEECTGCQYDMTTDDDVFLKAYNQKKPPTGQCSEDDFEKIMEAFETTADRQTPFAAVDNTVAGFEMMAFALKQDIDKKAQAFAKDIYDYWKTRRQCSSNRPLQPTLKFELHQDSDDGDPYVCFRRRDVRQTRKTRARDIQVTDKLRKLRKELEDGRQLILMSLQREHAKRDLLVIDRSIFEQRGKVKEIRQRLGIKVDDEVLINQKPQKRKPVEVPQLQRTPGTQIRIPSSRTDGRIIEADLTLLSDVLAQKENLLQMEIDSKIQQHQRWNQNHIDMTREPLSDARTPPPDSSFRLAMTQYPMTPPASVSEESCENALEPREIRGFSPPPEEEPYGLPSYRRRIGRLGRLWIDRRGLPSPPAGPTDSRSDRWKYDQDDDDDTPMYDVDPYDTNALKFRATIPYTDRNRRPPEIAGANGPVANSTASNPANRPSISLPSQKPT